MKNLIFYEIKKIMKNRLLLVVIISSLLLNVLYVYSNNKEKVSNSFTNGQKEVYEQIKGKITQEKYDFIFKNYDKTKKVVDSGEYDTSNSSDKYYTGFVFGDMNLFHELLNGYTYAIDYKQKISNAVDMAYDNLKIYNNKDDLDLNNDFINSFSNRSIGYYYETSNMTKYIFHDFSSFLIIVLLIIMLSGLFSEEIEYQYYYLLHTTKLGEKKLVFAKLYSAVLITIFLSFAFYIEDFFLFKNIGILDGFMNPIFSLPVFQYSSASFSIIFYLAINYMVKLCCLIFTSLLICLISYLNKKVLTSVLISFMLIITLMYCNNFFINPYNLFFIRQSLYEYSIWAFLHLNIPMIYEYLIAIFLEMIMMFLVCIMIMKGGNGSACKFKMGIKKAFL